MMGIGLEVCADWASLISLVIGMISLYLIGSVKANVIASRRKTRLRQLINEIKTIPDDAVPLSKASKSKFRSLERNLPSGYFPFFWSTKRKTIRDIKSAIEREKIEEVKECVADYISLLEDL